MLYITNHDNYKIYNYGSSYTAYDKDGNEIKRSKNLGELKIFLRYKYKKQN